MIVGKADCGLQYAVKRRISPVAYCALSIKCGTRDEEGFNGGIAHFVEHTIFKGTSKRSAAVINGYLDKLGGELNAFTTKEEIVIHATVLKEDLNKAGVDLPGEFVFEVSFKEHRDAVRRSFFPGFRLADDRTIVMETRDFMDVLRAVQFVL